MLFSYVLTFLLLTLGVTCKQCPPAVVALASGIHINIVGQMAELNATKTLLALESSKGFSEADFLTDRGELISDVHAGINIRKFNFAVVPKGNPAIPGLHKYKMAQMQELAIAEGLTGKASHDLPMLHKLHNDITAGIKLNMRNLKAATSKHHCSLGFQLPAYPGK